MTVIEGTPRCSVILRCKNSERTIGQALAALFSQDFRDFDLLAVDSGSTDRTLEILSHFPHRQIRIDPWEYFPGKVLNRAVVETRGEIIVFLNSDAAPLTAGALRRLIAAFDEPEVQGAFARQVPRPDAEAWVRRDYAVSFPDAQDPPAWIPYSLPLAAMRRSAWERHPFYTDAWGSEDIEWGVYARKEGWKVRYVPDAIVMHSHNYTLRQLYGRRFIEGEADAWIHGRPLRLPVTVVRTIASSLRDIAPCVRERQWTGILLAPIRRLTFHWAYLRGHRHGTRRRRRGDTDASVGQQTVLSRHADSGG